MRSFARNVVQRLWLAFRTMVERAGTAMGIAQELLKKKIESKQNTLKLWKSKLKHGSPKQVKYLQGKRKSATNQSDENWEMTELGGEGDLTEEEIEWYEKGLRD